MNIQQYIDTTLQPYILKDWGEQRDTSVLTAPYDGRTLAHIPRMSKADVDQAITAAAQAKEAMAALPAHQRGDILDRLVSLLEQKQDIAAALICAETAKPIRTAKEEVARTIQTYRFAAHAAYNQRGETLPMDAAPNGVGRIGLTMREPLGIIGAITPFNFPLNLVAHKIGPAIASGNTVILKPASQTPLSAYFLGQLLTEAGLPAGAFHIVTGSGKTIGDALVTDDRVQMITFTGSSEVGKEIRAKAGLKKVTLELGSNSALIVDKQIDPHAIAKRCAIGAFTFQGQVCISLQRIYVHEDLYDEFVAAFINASKSLVTGDPTHDETDISALISENDAARVHTWINDALEAGATLGCGGHRDGAIIEPTVLLHVPKETRISCDEVFGPVVLINRIASLEEGITHVNDSRYGLQAGIYTNDIHRALNAAKKLHVGGVMINDIPTYRVDHMPYGGVKESGTGREGITYAIEEMTELKLVVFNQLK
ncbi:aldehyde dehydrogenase family protein [Bacillus sp. FSL W7-1360]